MGFDSLAVNDLVRIAAAGAGFEVSVAGKSVNDLVRIAASAKNGGGSLTITGVGALAVNDMVRIGAASGGSATLKW